MLIFEECRLAMSKENRVELVYFNTGNNEISD
jgi:hypothetical protein